MDYSDYKTPSEVADILRISRATISRLVKRGAPVHYWGTSQRSYRILVDEFVQFMNDNVRIESSRPSMSLEEMRRRRRMSV